MEKETYTTSEAAEQLGVSSARVRQMVLEGLLPAEKFGRDLVITSEALEAARKRKTTPGPAPKSRTEGKSVTIEFQTKTTRKLDNSIKRKADRQMSGKKRGAKK